LIKGYEVMRWMNLMLNLHHNVMKFLRSTNALQWNNTWEIIDKCKIINAFCFELLQLCDIVFKIVNACYVYNAFQVEIKWKSIKCQSNSNQIKKNWIWFDQIFWTFLSSCELLLIKWYHFMHLCNHYGTFFWSRKSSPKFVEK